MCRVCWSADAVTDVILSGKGTKAITKQDSGTNACCSYGISGMNGIQGYDCLHIPGARKASDSAVIKGVCQAGGVGGVVTASGTTGATVCCKLSSRI